MAVARLSRGEAAFIESGVLKDARVDGRCSLDLRHLVVEHRVVEFCNGSALVERVQTGSKVIVGVKAQVLDMDEHLAQEDAEGVGSSLVDVSVDCTALKAAEAEAGTRSTRDLTKSLVAQVEAQLAVMLHGRENLLHVVPDKHAWALAVDVMVLGTDGNLQDLVSLAVSAALTDTVLPATEIVETETGHDFQINPDLKSATSLPKELLEHLPISVSLFRIGSCMVADASREEEQCASSALIVQVDALGRICGTQIARAGGVPLASLATHLQHACQIASELFKLLEAAHKEFLAAAPEM